MSRKIIKYWSIYGVFLLVYFVVMQILELFAVEGTSLDQCLKVMAFIFLLLFLLPWIIGGGIAIVKYFVGSMNNIHYSKDKLFNELDNYNTHWGETKEHYQDMINVINFYYKKDGKVDSVVGKDLFRLFNRKEFLERELETKEYFCMCLISVGLSICATLFLEYMRAEDGYPTWNGIVCIVLFFAVVLFKYFEPFNEGSNQIYKYELELLKKKIEYAEQEVLVDFQREDMMLTKQNVLVTLMDKCKMPFGKKHDEITNDIRTIEGINLNVEEGIIEYKEIKFIIGKTKREGVLFVDKNNKLINCQYETLYKILRKYDLICEIENMEGNREK